MVRKKDIPLYLLGFGLCGGSLWLFLLIRVLLVSHDPADSAHLLHSPHSLAHLHPQDAPVEKAVPHDKKPVGAVDDGSLQALVDSAASHEKELLKQQLEDAQAQVANLKKQLDHDDGKDVRKEIGNHKNDAAVLRPPDRVADRGNDKMITLKQEDVPPPHHEHMFYSIPESGAEQPFHGVLHPERLIDSEDGVIPVLLFTYNRPDVLKKSLETIFRRMPRTQFRLFVSQDSLDFPAVSDILKSYEDMHKLTRLVHKRDTSGAKPEEEGRGWESYFAISHHYKFAINDIFLKFPRYQQLIILEEDIQVGVDFFDYMRSLAPVMASDPTIYCVSAWNDNGKPELIADPLKLYRSDFFPGLGWMVSRRVWNELEGKWPPGFFDDWMRQNVQRQNRACIRPEVPRTFTWCTEEGGASQGQFCDSLQNIKLIDAPVNWRAHDLSYLRKDTYDTALQTALDHAIQVNTASDIHMVQIKNRDIKIEYKSNEEFVQLANSFGIMNDFKEGVPRTAYKGVVSFRFQNHLVHLFTNEPYVVDDAAQAGGY